MHKYNNQDHSMLTAMLAVENIVDATDHDLWSVNVDDEYHEQSSAASSTGAPWPATASSSTSLNPSSGRDAPVFSSR